MTAAPILPVPFRVHHGRPSDVTGAPLPTDPAVRRALTDDLRAALLALLESRPRLNWHDYAGDVREGLRAYRADQRANVRALATGRALLAEAWIGADLDALTLARPSRLRIYGWTDDAGALLAIDRLEYVPGQYYPVEYRPAVVGWLADVVARKWDPAAPWGLANRARLRRRFGRWVGSL